MSAAHPGADRLGADDELEAHVRRLVDAAPPLSQQQRDRLTVVVRAHRPPPRTNAA